MKGSKMWPEGDSRSGEDIRLDGIFQAYRVACEPRDVSANFRPDLWQKIEKAQKAIFSFRRMARSFVTAAAAVSLGLVMFEVLPVRQNSAVYNLSYVEALAAHNEALDARSTSESIEYVQDLMHPDSAEEAAEEL